ncbi:MAG: hypothetical protein JO076_07455 [Verrucomicrobia bacterium]|nr:hypothetical protein [Verrucomicrobiota bacterium]
MSTQPESNPDPIEDPTLDEIIEPRAIPSNEGEKSEFPGEDPTGTRK